MWPAWDSELVQEMASMNHDAHVPLMLILASRSPVGRLTVDLQSFLQFSAEIDRSLENLERRWSDFSTPAGRQRAALRGGNRTR